MDTTPAEAAFQSLAAAFASPEPLPAGGAAGVTALAMGVGLGIKVLRISLGAAQDGTPQDDSRVARLEALRARLEPAFATDCAAFAALMDALRRPRSDAGRADRVREGWKAATAEPVGVAVLARDAEALLAACSAKPSVQSDLEAALDLVRCARGIAERNARDNAARLDDATAAAVLAPLAAPRSG